MTSGLRLDDGGRSQQGEGAKQQRDLAQHWSRDGEDWEATLQVRK